MRIPVMGIFWIILLLQIGWVVPQGLYQLLATNGLTEFQRLVNSSFAVKGLLINPSLELTIFVPTNEAFVRWKSINRLTSISSDILQNHIAPGTYNERTLIDIAESPAKRDRRIVSAYLDAPIWIRYISQSSTVAKAKMYVNNALVTDKPIEFGRQIMYIIDDLIAPTGTSVTAAKFLDDPSAQSHSDVALGEVRREVEQLTQIRPFQQTDAVFTFLLPNDAALVSLRNRGAFDGLAVRGHIIPNEVLFLRTFNESLPFASQVLSKSVGFPTMLSGGSGSLESCIGFSNTTGEAQIFSLVTKGDNRFPAGRVYANVVKANIPVQNGVIHVIDRVLLIVEQNAREIMETRRGLFKFREWFNGADARLLEKLRSDNDITIFIPTNKAISSLPVDKAERLRHDKQFTERIINMHIVPKRLSAEQLNNGTVVLSLQGHPLVFKVFATESSRTFFVEGGGVNAKIIEPDLASTNAVIHVIDEVLGMPFLTILEKLRADASLDTTYRAVEQTKDLSRALGSTTSNYTVFAPSNQAWLNLPAQDRAFLLTRPNLLAKVFKRHVVSGRRMDGTSFRNGERVLTMSGDVLIKQTQDRKETLVEWNGHIAKLSNYDLGAVNGVVHVIDQVLFDRGTDVSINCSCYWSCSSLTVIFLLLLNVIGKV